MVSKFWQRAKNTSTFLDKIAVFFGIAVILDVFALDGSGLQRDSASFLQEPAWAQVRFKAQLVEVASRKLTTSLFNSLDSILGSPRSLYFYRKVEVCLLYTSRCV